MRRMLVFRLSDFETAMSSPLRPRTVYLKPLGAMLLAVGLAGCAQQSRPGYYDVPRESTLSDAQNQAQGRSGARAPSQIQLGFGRQEAQQAQPEAAPERAAAAKARPLTEAKTFLGTVPCPPGNTGCTAARITLTLAPGGEWRARTTLLGTPEQKPMAQQGCWDVTGTDPLRIVLMLKNNQAGKASLSFVNDNVLRILTLDDVQPLVEHRLTRQPDIDGIAELPGEPLNCSLPGAAQPS